MAIQINIRRISLLYILSLVCVVILGVLVYISNTNRFHADCDVICQEHANLTATIKEIAVRDSIVKIDHETVSKLQAGNDHIGKMLEMQHREIEEDFSNLMLWASVLMIIFLVFSIYSMYRTDELVKQGRDSVAHITDLSTKAQSKISEMDSLYEKESTKLSKRTQELISELKNNADTDLRKFKESIDSEITNAKQIINKDIEEYKNDIGSESEKLQAQLEDVQKAVTGILKILHSPSSGDNK